MAHCGASFTFVSGKTKLTNGRPTEGYVHVADGRKQKIEEIGDYGSLRNARRVASFQRTLVSVSDLVEQYGRVLFDGEGVHVCTPAEAAKNWIYQDQDWRADATAVVLVRLEATEEARATRSTMQVKGGGQASTMGVRNRWI